MGANMVRRLIRMHIAVVFDDAETVSKLAKEGGGAASLADFVKSSRPAVDLAHGSVP